MRINRYLSQAGRLSRRAADNAIVEGRVTIGDRQAQIGDQVDPERDEVYLDGRRVLDTPRWYLAFYKPRFVITTMHDPEGRPCVRDFIPERYAGVFPAGRLDFDAQGLIILTNDGELANTIHHPTHGVAKEYIVRLRPEASQEALKSMAQGILLDGRKTRPATITRLKDDDGGTVVRIILRQGLKNQIKRMAQAVNLEVISIARTGVGPVRLQNLHPGQIRELTASEVEHLRNNLNKRKVT